MLKILPAPRKELSKYAPRIETIRINPEKIGLLIGPGGKNIKKLVEESGCEINIEDDGTVNIYSVAEEGMKIARDAEMGVKTEEALPPGYEQGDQGGDRGENRGDGGGDRGGHRGGDRGGRGGDRGGPRREHSRH
jgi:hypothetical protein